MSNSLPVSRVEFTRTKPRGDRANPTTEYSALLHTVRDAGLLKRRSGFYYLLFGGLMLALGGVIVGFVLLGPSWYQLILAGVLGLILTQFAFLAHEASHRQVFASGRANDWVGRTLGNLFVGISYSWWMNKHTRHHGNPNTIGKDPDIDPDTIVFVPADAAQIRGVGSLFTRRQGYLFFPILIFEGVNLHIHGFRTVFGRGKVDKRPLEIVMLSSRILLYVAVIFLALPPGMAAAFIGVQLAVFGVYMGSSFAPNHIGMPLIPHDLKVDFLRRQVMTSRNVGGGWFIRYFMGGLNYQIEHHLFPSMPRPALAQARLIAREYCESHDIAYTETNLIQAYVIVVDYLNSVGLAAGRDAFRCPAASSLGR
jgi:fatty acid desaturase